MEEGLGQAWAPVAVPFRRADASVDALRASARPRAHGKFLFLGDEKLCLRGATYGTFAPDMHGDEFPEHGIVERDFAQMAANGLNAVRVFTAPPRLLLDAAREHGLHVLVGLSAERYVGFLADKNGAPDIEGLVRTQVRACAAHPAVLGYALGNEIPASLVRWLGGDRVQRYLERLFRAVKAEDPDGLVTYANYPSTEYLELPFLDFVCFNVYLESQARLEAYLLRLQNLAGDRPLVMGEVGLDSRRHGEDTQACVLDWQTRTAFAAGCAGVFVFAWTDDWYTGGDEVDDWDFGLTTRDRRPKPALAAVREAFAQVPFPPDLDWPRVSVIVCCYNGERTLRDCFEGLLRLEYPDFEVIVVDDGSNDATAAITREYGFRLIATEKHGLGSARNTGLEAATGEIVAYLDADAYPDPHWLTYLTSVFLKTPHVGVGGPNIAPPDDGAVAACVAVAPGGPVHVLLSDSEAEHVPGCNAAFRTDALRSIGGFDPRFRVAGDDVDVCWQFQERGLKIGFSPSAVVWHHRRNSIRAYWRQQRAYGEAEALLERKWPEKYKGNGHARWAGRVYGNGQVARPLGRAGRIYYGTWGSAPFQSLYRPAPTFVWSLPALPDWYLSLAAIAAMSALGALWSPLLVLLPALGIAVLASLAHAWLSSARAPFSRPARPSLRLRALTALLHLLQPIARLDGHLRGGLVPWRRRGDARAELPRRRTFALWSEQWQAPQDRLRAIESHLRRPGLPILRGGAHDGWDLEARSGALGSARLIMGVEDHALGRQLVRVRWWPHLAPIGLWLAIPFAALAVGAALDGAIAASALLAAVPVALAARAFQECAVATAAIAEALESWE
jgi:GT2 family glycosyltransferase